MKIKVGYLIAYDYELLKISLPTIYNDAHTITLAIDKERKTFAGEIYTIDPSFFSWLKEFDVENKIVIYEDQFYKSGLTASDTETKTRNMLAKVMGNADWYFQIDVDEYFINFKELINQLQQLDDKFKNKKVTIMTYLTSIFKIDEDGFFIITNPEKFALATNNPVYTAHRYNVENEKYVIDNVAIHQSWGRNEEELKTKLNNWGHRLDFNTDSYFKFWKSLNVHNYKYIKDFNPINPGLWSNLYFISGTTIQELLSKMPHSLNIQQQKWAPLRKWLPPVVYNRLQKL